MAADDQEERKLRAAALKNAESILLARQRAERELLVAKEALEKKNDELQQQREWFRVTLSSIGDAVITTDLQGNVAFMNPVAAAMTGWMPDEAEGRPLTEVLRIVNEATRQPVGHPVHRVLHDGVVVGLANHTVLLKRDGTETAIEDSAAPIRDSNGKLAGAVMVFHDVTARRQAEAAAREQTRILEILNRTGAAIARHLDLPGIAQLVTDGCTELIGAAFGAFIYKVTNQHGEALLRYSLTGAPDNAFETVAPLGDAPDFDIIIRRVGVIRAADITRDAGNVTMSPHYGLPSGWPVRSYLSVPVVSHTGEAIGALFFGHPVPGVFSERTETLVVGVAAQAAVAMDNARLYEAAQREIASRERAEAALRETDRRKDEFLATLAHELRNPLAPIRQAAQISTAAGATDAQMRWSRDVIGRQVHHMSLLLDDLLDISRITRGTLELRLRPTELSEVIDAAIETARPSIDAKRHRFQVERPPVPVHFVADPLRLAQVLSNLLTNAAKYTDPEGQIGLRAECISGDVVLTVTDTGIGLPTESQTSVFEMFSQVKSGHDRSEGGLGIGLALARGLVELHGGQIDVKSAGLGLGSAFIVRLPRRAPAAEPAAAQARQSEDLRTSRRVLIADDNRDAADSLAMILQMEGHEVNVVYDGAAAVEAVSRFLPHVVLLDIGMPGLDGYEVAQRVRQGAIGSTATLIAVTGWGQSSDKVRALAAGFDHHFTKPIEPEHITRLLR